MAEEKKDSNVIAILSTILLGSNLLLFVGAVALGLITATIVLNNISFAIPTFGLTNTGTGLVNEGTCSDLTKIEFSDGSNAREIINRASKDTGLPASSIVAIMSIESSFKQDAISRPDGTNPIAYGLMQTIPPTYNAYRGPGEPVKYRRIFVTQPADGGKPYDSYVVDGENYILTDPYAATFAGAGYFKSLLDEFGSEEKAAAAYNWGPDNVRKGYKYTESVKDYIQKYNQAKTKYTNCEDEAQSGETAQILIDYVNNAPKQTTCQFDNGTGSSGCYQTVEKVLEAAFPGSNGRGDGSWIRDYSSDQDIVNRPPSAQDISDAVAILKRGTKEPIGNLPVWHIRGNGSGQHWIVVVGVEGTNIKFFDPEYGEIRTQPTNLKSSKGWYYFAVTAKGAGDNSNYKRGYEFSPKR